MACASPIPCIDGDAAFAGLIGESVGESIGESVGDDAQRPGARGKVTTWSGLS
jgi:hypothetical protein